MSSLRSNRRPVLVGALLLLLALAAAVLGTNAGQFSGHGITSAQAFVIDQLLLPRVLTAVLAGAALALAGAVFQSVTRNPLGSPDILGLTQGAATGALLGFTALGGSVLAVAGCAWLGAVGTAAAVYLVAGRSGTADGTRLILVGIGVAALLAGVDQFLITRAGISDAAQAAQWITGSLAGSAWSSVALLAGAGALLVPPLLLAARVLGVLELGDDLATGLGLRTGHVRLLTLAGAVLLSATAASQAGPVAFVALVSPHLARRLTRGTGPQLPSSLLLGAALLAWADYLGQHLIPGRQLPVGVVTGVLGGCYLVHLLARHRTTGRP